MMCCGQKDYIPITPSVGIHLNEAQRYLSLCIRCNTCDGYPCLVQAKVMKLHTSPSGREITGVEVDVQGKVRMFSGDIVAIACGAINSSVLLLKSANEKHPNGLANSSGLVGRNFMKHVLGSIIGVFKKPNPTLFQKTLSINDFYWGDEGYDYLMGQIQTLGKVSKEALDGLNQGATFTISLPLKD